MVENDAVPFVGTFVDIGAGDGIRGSNTLYFENHGWTGLCVDPDPRNYSSLSRRRCQVQTCAVSATPGTRRFGMHRHKPSWSGLARSGEEYIDTVVTARRLHDLLLDTGIERIDLLSIDVEGTELDVWTSFDDTRYRPAIVIIEFDDDDPLRTREAIRRALGPMYALAHRTPANLVFTRGDRHASEPGRAARSRPAPQFLGTLASAGGARLPCSSTPGGYR